LEIIAAGQINRGSEDDYSGLIVLLRPQSGGLQLYAEQSFNVVIDGKKLATRVRSVEVLRDGTEGDWNVFLAGRGGGEDEAVGFLHHGIVKDDTVQWKGEKVFRHRDSTGTHGYPLAVADLDGEGSEEIIYGGFHRLDDRDKADIRVFQLNGGVLQERSRPFEHLPISLRVNALDVGDLDGDGSNDIVIAGRTGEPEKREFSAVAWWSNGSVAYHIFDDDNPSRLRTVLTADLDGDEKNELVTGGRLELEGLWLADLRCWILERGRLVSKDRFFWSLGNQMRLRSLSVAKDKKNQMKVAGRAERSTPDGAKRWVGFIWEFSFDGSSLIPIGSPDYYDRGLDTRIRHIHLTDAGSFVASGFTRAQRKGKTDQGLVWLLR
jgi:hypothetical protein